MDKLIKAAQFVVVLASVITVGKAIGQGVSAIKNRNAAASC